MSCAWIENREKKDQENSVKYGPLQWELQERYPGYTVHQYKIIMDVLGGWSRTMQEGLRKLLGEKTKDVLRNMQKSVVSSTLNIARMFKINHNMNSKIIEETLERLNIIRTLHGISMKFILMNEQ